MPEGSREPGRQQLGPSEYIGLVLAIATPLFGLFFAIYLRYDRSPWGLRLIGISIVSAAAWAGLIILS